MIKFDRSNDKIGYLNRGEILDAIEDACENCKTKACRDCGMYIAANHILNMSIVTDDMIMFAKLKNCFKEAAEEYESKGELNENYIAII